MNNTDYDNMKWSYSRVNSFITCPRMFYFQYIDNKKGLSNAFAQYGTFMHELIEDVCNEKKDNFKALIEYKSNFEEKIPEKFPFNKYSNLKDKYYKEGINYLSFFNKFKGYKIVETERKLDFTLGGYKFTGYIDLVLRDKDGNVILLDHKSKGSIKPHEKEEYFRQLYLYATQCEALYGTKPHKLVLNLFRSGTSIVTKYNEEASEKAISRLLDTIECIKVEKEFKPKWSTITQLNKDFFCKEICSHRKNCRELVKNAKRKAK